MFERWGRLVFRHRRLVFLAGVLVGLAALPLAAGASKQLSPGGWEDPGSQSAAVSQAIETRFGEGGSTLLVLYRTANGASVRSPAVQSAIAASLAPLLHDPRVAGAVGYAETADPRFVSRAGDATYVAVELRESDDGAMRDLDALRAELRSPGDGLTMQLTGAAPVNAAVTAQSERDLGRAETLSLPLTLLVLLLIFGSLVAAGMPLLVAGLAIPTALGAVAVLARLTPMSVFVSSVITMLGLALAIDYSLFMVSRFREELRAGRSVEDAVAIAVATSGRAIAFSGIAVAIGLSGLLFFTAAALTSMGIGGSLVALASVGYALTFLPAALGLLGRRVDRLSPAGLWRFLRRGRAGDPADQASRPVTDGRWARLARLSMAHPLLVIGPVLALLLGLGAPFLGIRQGVPGADLLPASAESRQALETLGRDFPAGETSPIVVLAETRGDPLAPDEAAALASLGARLATLPGVGHVESPFSLTDPASGAALPPATVAALVAGSQGSQPPALRALLAADVRGSTVRFDVVTPYDAGDSRAEDLVRAIRSLPGDGLQLQVGGAAAQQVDFLDSQSQRLPFAVGFVLLVLMLVLFLQFGSVVLPVKAVAMTLLSISASFGALVWVFQQGHLSGPLHFEPLGYTIAGNPVLMFCFLFGLSMDYEVLLLSRIQEAYRRTGDNRAAVAEGLAATGRIITGAALIMVTVFAAFGLADLLIIKSLGVGMAIAVFLDATVIRVLLVPAVMRLLGRWNWWAPGPLGSFADRVGFRHVNVPRVGAGDEGAASA